MSLQASWVMALLALLVLSQGKISQQTHTITKQRAPKPPEKPSISNSFQVSVEGIFKDKNTGAEGTLYFDGPNNIAAMDLLWKNDFKRTIYSFDTDELISIQGRECDVKKIPDNPGDSFFPFTVDPKSKRKILGSPEEALYFNNSIYAHDDYHGDIEAYMYLGYIDVPIYNRKNCTVTHYFSNPSFETAGCDSRFCKPVLLTISVCCAGVEVEEDGIKQVVGEVDHVYRVYNFRDSIVDENVFHIPPGIYCDRKSSKKFPSLPMYFSFSYDVTEKAVKVGNVGGLKTLHKKVWYDGHLELIRVDAFDDDGLLDNTQIYDFYNEMEYSTFPQINTSSRENLKAGVSVHLITLLPPEVFPRTFQQSGSSPVFAGSRSLHGLKYNVWAVRTKATDGSSEVVTELYFQTIVSEKDGEVVKEGGQQLSFIEINTYISDEDSDITELSQVIFAPINNFQSSFRDYPEFDLCNWFDEDEKRAFEIDVTGPELLVGTKVYSDFLQQVYLEILTTATISIIRICKLQITSSDPATNSTTFSGCILESTGNLGYTKKTNESDTDTAFAVLEKLTREAKLEISVPDEFGTTLTFLLGSFRQARTGNKDAKGDMKYSGGVMAATAVTVFILGLAFGVFGITALRKKHAEKERYLNLIGQPSTDNRTMELNNLPEVSQPASEENS